MDPAAKAAAASVLASKLGSESGLKFALQAADMLQKEDFGRSPNAGRHHDLEGAESPSLRKVRRTFLQKAGQVDRRTSSGQSSQHIGYNERVEGPGERGGRDIDAWEYQKEVETRGKPNEGGWIARLAAMLIGEDPSQCYALICGKCHMHNGRAKKDCQNIIYFCPHCHALNKSNHLEGGNASDWSGGSAGSRVCEQ